MPKTFWVHNYETYLYYFSQPLILGEINQLRLTVGLSSNHRLASILLSPARRGRGRACRIIRKGGSNAHTEEHQRLYLLAAFEMDHFQPVKLISFPNLSIFLTFILEAPISYYPRKMKRENIILQKWMRLKGVGTWGIRIGPF